jgi:CubicO group peptidase (beta-lactamase class C family)
MTRGFRALLAALALLVAPHARGQAPDLSGLWVAKLRFGPDVRGPLIITKTGNDWVADIAGYRIPAQSKGREISFALPDNKGNFRGKFSGNEIAGHWMGTRSYPYAALVILSPLGAGKWRGNVQPFENTTTFFMPLKRAEDGSYSTYLRNPESNVGRFIPVTTVRVNGKSIELSGKRGLYSSGVYDDGVMRLLINGNSFDFERDTTSLSSFFSRGRNPQRYVYTKPLALDDDWPVATLDEAGISRPQIEKFIQMLSEISQDSITTPQLHSVLIARHGKLVLEEYFHGADRDTPHDLRSASKSWVSMLLGAAMQSGVPIKLSAPVYQTMLGTVPPDLDPRKKAMTLEHLISMTAGFNCAGSDAPGDEDVMQQQDSVLDWYRYTLNVPMLTAPGDTIVYCSIEPNLAGGMLQKIAHESLADMSYRLLSKPMKMSNYSLFISPVGDVYGGGGHRFTSRDFLKWAQLMLNHGAWNGRQIMSREWVEKSGTAMRLLFGKQSYGYLWNSYEFDWNGRKVRAIFAGGNGGQVSMAIPALDMAIVFTGANYGQAQTFTSQQVYVPRFILPAVTGVR